MSTIFSATSQLIVLDTPNMQSTPRVQIVAERTSNYMVLDNVTLAAEKFGQMGILKTICTKEILRNPITNKLEMLGKLSKDFRPFTHHSLGNSLATAWQPWQQLGNFGNSLATLATLATAWRPLSESFICDLLHNST